MRASEFALLLAPAVDAQLLLSILPSALLAGLVAVLATIVVERFGGVVGGVLSTVPTTIVAYAIGLHGQAATTDDFRRALAFVPVGILLNAAYLLVWKWLPPRLHALGIKRLLVSTIVLALTAWIIVATALTVAHDAMEPSVERTVLCGILAMCVGLTLALAATRRVHAAVRGTHRVSMLTFVLRGVGATIVVGVALFISRSGLPLVSGVVSVFPIIFTTVMVATWLAQGSQVPAGAAGPMALGTLSVSSFALLAAWLIPAYGLTEGATLAWFVSVGFVSAPAYLYLRSRQRHLKGVHAPSQSEQVPQ